MKFYKHDKVDIFFEHAWKNNVIRKIYESSNIFAHVDIEQIYDVILQVRSILFMILIRLFYHNQTRRYIWDDEREVWRRVVRIEVLKIYIIRSLITWRRCFDEIDDFNEMLIDLNLAKMLDDERSDARHQTSTMKFMIIEVLLDIDHIYRHDLESFFYVLIWLCARREWDFCENSRDRSKESVLTKWYIDNFKNIARSKLDDMHIDEFDDILKKFSSFFDWDKALCKKIRDILFSLLKNETLFKETRSNSFEKLYDVVIEAFDDAIVEISFKQEWE